VLATANVCRQRPFVERTHDHRSWRAGAQGVLIDHLHLRRRSLRRCRTGAHSEDDCDLLRLTSQLGFELLISRSKST
jgi:hypothetical protein